MSPPIIRKHEIKSVANIEQTYRVVLIAVGLDRGKEEGEQETRSHERSREGHGLNGEISFLFLATAPAQADHALINLEG